MRVHVHIDLLSNVGQCSGIIRLSNSDRRGISAGRNNAGMKSLGTLPLRAHPLQPCKMVSHLQKTNLHASAFPRWLLMSIYCHSIASFSLKNHDQCICHFRYHYLTWSISLLPLSNVYLSQILGTKHCWNLQDSSANCSMAFNNTHFWLL